VELPERIGRYEVEVLLGQGGMGRVLLARDPVLRRQVAIKVLRNDLGLTPELRAELLERMRQEARAAATLSHPAIVTLHDMGEDESAGLYLVFELIKGPTLRERLLRGPLAPIEVAQLARALGSGLSHAHAAGVVHRDVKPENVMLSPAVPKLTDFGIARLPDSTLTRATKVLGTPAYSAPEAIASGTFAPSSDQFSLATTLYEALTGMRAFAGDDALVVASRVATAKHAAPSGLAPGLRGFIHLDAIFERALAKDARKRFPSCEAFCNALAAELEGANAGLLTPAAPSSIVPRSTRRWQNAVAAVAVLVIGGLLILGRQQHTEGGSVSLKSVASAFSAAISSARVPPPNRHPHAALAPSSSTEPSASTSTPSSLPVPTPTPAASF
jgi:serine/threonine protein kinase